MVGRCCHYSSSPTASLHHSSSSTPTSTPPTSTSPALALAITFAMSLLSLHCAALSLPTFAESLPDFTLHRHVPLSTLPPESTRHAIILFPFSYLPFLCLSTIVSSHKVTPAPPSGIHEAPRSTRRAEAGPPSQRSPSPSRRIAARPLFRSAL